MSLGDFIGGLGKLVEQINQLAEGAEKLKRVQTQGETVDVGKDGVKAMYGFTIRTGLGGDKDVKVEPFGNFRKDDRTGATVVDEVREPAVDVFEEADHVLVVAEMPGIGEDEVRLELRDNVLTISAERGAKKYRKEVPLPSGFSALSHSCRNGVLEVKVGRS